MWKIGKDEQKEINEFVEKRLAKGMAKYSKKVPATWNSDGLTSFIDQLSANIKVETVSLVNENIIRNLLHYFMEY
jgi:hypothetical protein